MKGNCEKSEVKSDELGKVAFEDSELREAKNRLVLKEIALEHRRIAVSDGDDEISRKLYVSEERFHTAHVEIEAVRLLKRLRRSVHPPGVPVVNGRFGPEVGREGYGAFYYMIRYLIALRSPNFLYDPHLEVMYEIMKNLMIIENDSYGRGFCMLGLPLGKESSRLIFEKLICDTWEALRSPEFKKNLDGRVARSRRIRNAFIGMLHRCLKRSKNIEIVRVDLEYLLEDIPKNDDPISPDCYGGRFNFDVFQRDREDFINNLRDMINRKNMPSLMEWGWKAECGELRGWHLHCVFMFAATEVNSAWCYAMKVGDLWVRLTDGRGAYFNYCYDKRSFGQSCLGEVRDGDAEAISRFRMVADFLSKDDQMAITRTSKCNHVFGISRNLNADSGDCVKKGVGDV